MFSGMSHTVKLTLQFATEVAAIGAAMPGSDSSIRPAMHRTVERKDILVSSLEHLPVPDSFYFKDARVSRWVGPPFDFQTTAKARVPHIWRHHRQMWGNRA